MNSQFPQGVAIILIMFSNFSFAQDISSFSNPFGSIVITRAEVMETSLSSVRILEEGAQPKVNWLFSPAAGYTDGSNIVGGAVISNIELQNGRRLEFDVLFSNINFDDHGRRDNLTWNGKYNFYSSPSGIAIGIYAEHMDLEKLFEKSGVGLSVSKPLSTKIKLFGNAGRGMKDTDNLGSEYDFDVRVGFGATINPNLIFTVDYALDNDISQDLYSFTAIIRGSWFVHAIEGDTFSVAYTIPLN